MRLVRGFGLVIALSSGAVLCMPTLGASARGVEGGFRTCAEFRAEWPLGVARTVVAARKQKIRPEVNWFIYDQNKQLDRDKDATVCEVHVQPRPKKSETDSATTTSVSVDTSTTSTSAPGPVVCPIANTTVTNVIISSASDPKLVKLPNDVLRVSRTVKGKIQNKSSLSVFINFLSLLSTFNGDQVDLVNVVTSDTKIIAGGTYKWTVKYVQEVSPLSSLGDGTYAFAIATEDFLIFTDDPRCP